MTDKIKKIFVGIIQTKKNKGLKIELLKEERREQCNCKACNKFREKGPPIDQDLIHQFMIHNALEELEVLVKR